MFDSTLGASAASIDVTGISATYAHLMVSVYARGDTAATAIGAQLRFNGDSAANYDTQYVRGNAAVASAAEGFAATSLQFGSIPANTAGANLFGAQEIFIPYYAGSSNNKQIVALSSAKIGTSTGNLFMDLLGGGWRSNAAINQITFFPVSGNFVAGTRITVHALGA